MRCGFSVSRSLGRFALRELVVFPLWMRGGGLAAAAAAPPSFRVQLFFAPMLAVSRGCSILLVCNCSQVTRHGRVRMSLFFRSRFDCGVCVVGL